MHIYRYERFVRPQAALDDDRKLASGIRSEFLALQWQVQEAINLAEEPVFKDSLRGLDHALYNFMTDEFEPIMRFLDGAQDDLDKKRAE